MEMERVIETKRLETTQDRRKGLILYLILFSTYLLILILILILWRNMDKWHGNGTRHRNNKIGNNTRSS